MKRNAKNAVETVEVEAEIAGGTPAERINTYVREAQRHGRIALEYLVKAGWELLIQKQSIGYGGGWESWVEKNLSISKFTADRYIQFYQRTLGDKRSEARIAITREPTKKELADATAGMEYKTATQAMVDMGIVKRPAAWGGAGRGQGRKPKDAAEVAAEVAAEKAAEKAASEASIRAELSAEEGRDLVQKLAGWALGADDGFGALSDGELARVVKTLKQVLARAEEIQSAREDAR